MPIRVSKSDFLKYRICKKCHKLTFADDKDCIHCTKTHIQTTIADYT